MLERRLIFQKMPSRKPIEFLNKNIMAPHVIMLAILCMCSSSAFSLDCKNAISTLELNECASIEQKNVEEKLNVAYRKLLIEIERLDVEGAPGLKKEFIDAQRAWIRFRDLDCKAIYTRWAAGTVRNLQYFGCMQSHAKQRISEFESYLPDL